jgi:hypothetical protein
MIVRKIGEAGEAMGPQVLVRRWRRQEWGRCGNWIMKLSRLIPQGNKFGNWVPACGSTATSRMARFMLDDVKAMTPAVVAIPSTMKGPPCNAPTSPR